MDSAKPSSVATERQAIHSLRCPGLTKDAVGLAPLDKHCL